VSDATDSLIERQTAASEAHTNVPGLTGKRAVVAPRRKDDE
jgi:hypothetical protein